MKEMTGVFWCMGRKRREDLEMSFRMPKGTKTCQLLGNLSAAEDSELCGNYTFWSQQPCPPHMVRCLGSFNGQCNTKPNSNDDSGADWNTAVNIQCQDGSIQFVSKSPCKEKCKFKGAPVCLEKEHRCDQIPNCDDGRDENDCREEYLRKGLTHPDADFECESPKFNSETFPNASVWIWAVRCDGNPTCWRELDEEGCDLGIIIIYVVGT